ncbi:MAG: DNA-directed RNA polymerase subunit omega [Eubacteriales bacterium]|nr:DNA-directed RNA polymerase subunit omega [Eubacteriales bacterium]
MAMLFPTYGDIINSVNKTSESGEPIIESRYSVVAAAAKRARQIIDGDHPTLDMPGEKALTIAIDELDEGTIKVIKSNEEVSE